MKGIKKWVGLIMLIGLSVNVWAHNPQITTNEVKNINDAWLMEISFPQVAVYPVLVRKYGEQAAESFTEKESKKKLVTYVKESTTTDFINKRLFCPVSIRSLRKQFFNQLAMQMQDVRQFDCQY